MSEQGLSFEQMAVAAFQKAAIASISKGEWLAVDYSSRVKIPPEFMAQMWALVDKEAMKRKLAERLETELVDRMVNHMAAELATDIKQILSVQERREALRAIARQHMDSIMAAGCAK